METLVYQIGSDASKNRQLKGMSQYLLPQFESFAFLFGLPRNVFLVLLNTHFSWSTFDQVKGHLLFLLLEPL